MTCCCIAKLLMTEPNIDLYHRPPKSRKSPIQALFDGIVPDEVKHQIFLSSEFQNLIRCDLIAFRDFLQEDEDCLGLIQSFCPDFASEIMNDQYLAGNARI